MWWQTKRANAPLDRALDSTFQHGERHDGVQWAGDDLVTMYVDDISQWKRGFSTVATVATHHVHYTACRTASGEPWLRPTFSSINHRDGTCSHTKREAHALLDRIEAARKRANRRCAGHFFGCTGTSRP